MLRDFFFGLNGVLMLLRLDGRGMLFFSPTGPGALRSFIVAIIIFPVYALITYLDWLKEGEPAAFHYFVMHFLGYAIGWMAYPVVMFELTRIMGVAGFFPRYLAAYNYSVIPITLFMLPIEMLNYLFPNQEVGMMGLVTIVMVMNFQWFICRFGLMVRPAIAVGLVLIDTTLSIIIHSLVNKLV